jgi:copper resistance protein C
MIPVSTRRRRRRPVTAALLCCSAMVAVVVALASPAQAHTDLISSVPAAGGRVATPPTEVTLTFTEEISPGLSAVSVVVDGTGDARLQLSTGPSTGDVVATVPESVRTSSPPDARWVINYRVTASDGHPIAGSLEFEVAAPAPQPAPAPTTRSAPQDPTGSAPATSSDEEASSDDNRTSSEQRSQSGQEVSADAAGDGVPSWLVPAGVLLLLGVLVLTAMRSLGRDE